MNSSQNIPPICDSTQNQTKIKSDICLRICPKDCSQVYYTLSLDNKYYLWKTNSIISIKYKSIQEFQYIAENSETFVSYLSNIGGLISLWFGMSFVDLENIIKYLFSNIRFVLLHKFQLDKIIKIIKSFMIKQFLTKLFQLIS